MELLFRLPYQVCKPIVIEETRYFFFKRKVQYWIAMTGDKITLLEENGFPLWSITGTFSHDFTFDYDNKLIIALEEKPIPGTDGAYQNYSRLNFYNLKGQMVKSWSPLGNKSEILSLIKWQPGNPHYKRIEAHIEENRSLLVANYIKWVEEPIKINDNLTLDRGTLLVNFKVVTAMIALNQNQNIFWHYNFNANPEDPQAYTIHTPNILNSGEIIAFHNAFAAGKGRSGVMRYFMDKRPMEPVFLIPSLYDDQQKRAGKFGSVQYLPQSDTYFISAGSEYGGIFHIKSNGELLFSWLNPIRVTEAGETYPRPVYRASLIDSKLFAPLDF